MMRWPASPMRPIVVRTADRAHCLQRGCNGSAAVDRCPGERSARGAAAGPLTHEARFRSTKKSSATVKLAPSKDGKIKANRVCWCGRRESRCLHIGLVQGVDGFL